MSLLSICTECTSGEKRLAERRKKAFAKLASKLKKLLANFKFHSHLASWRVVICTPAYDLELNERKNAGTPSIAWRMKRESEKRD
jgi:hypothetical protein